MSPTYDNNRSGVLFKNDRKRPNHKDPDYQGQCEIDRVQYWISAWINESTKDGSKFMSLKFNPKQASAVKGGTKNPPSQKAAAGDDFSDEIPF